MRHPSQLSVYRMPSVRLVPSALAFLTLLLGAMAPLPCRADGGSDLATGRLQIAGTRLEISPVSQTVPFDTPTIVETSLVGFDPGNGTLPADLWVVGDFKGPEIDGSLELRTRPGEPFRIPRLSLKGQYRLDDIRLVEGDQLLAYASPRSSAVLVTQVLVTKVTSRPLTLDEIRSYGIVVNEDSFEAFNFTFGFAIDGEVFDYNLPLIYEPIGKSFKVVNDSGGTGSLGTTSPRFSPPQLAPFTLELESSGEGGPGGGGCMDAENGCERDAPISLPGVIVFPTDVALLHQFFSVVMIAKNDAPLGDPLSIRDLKATISLPPGLRMAQTEPPTALGVPVPVLVPGADGILGTGDDLTFLIAQAEGKAEALVEGLTQGSHIVDFALEGFLEGLPGNVVRRIKGNARGAVVVRDSTLGVTITHPDVVRVGEDYSLLLTVSNTSNAPVNLVKLSLPPSGLSGVQLLSANSVTFPTLAPGESEVAEFKLRSQRTGKVVGSTIRGGSRIDPRFEFSVGVGDSGIPLSPTAIILPRSTEVLPELFVKHALSLVGLGYSLATAPPSALSPDMPQLTEEQIHEKVYWLGQAGRHHKMGEELFDSLAIFGAEWTGARDHDWEWDRLRRRTQKGALVGDSVGQVIAAEAAQHGDLHAFNRWAATTSFLGPLQAAMAAGPGVRLAVSSRATGQRLSGSGVDPTRLRELPFADLYELDGSQMAILASPEATGYRLTVTDADGGNFDLHLLAPTAAGVLRRLDWHGVALGLGGRAWLDYQGSDQQFTLKIDTDGDGEVDDELAPGSSLTVDPRPFVALGAVQQESDPGGHLVEILFSQDIDLMSLLPLDAARFTIPGKVSNGGLVPVEKDIANFFEVIAENPFEGLQNTRIVRVVFDNPISPYVESILTVRDIKSVLGDEVTGVGLPVTTTVTDPGGLVSGTVYGPDGQPAPGALVELFQSDYRYHDGTCLKNRTAAVKADASGNFLFDYVRQTTCSDIFSLVALDTASGKKGTAQGRVRFVGQTVDLDILMLGRGSIRGRVTYQDGTVPANLRVVAFSPVFAEGRVARISEDGNYEVGDLPVGTISLAAGDGLGNFGYQTVEIPTAGAETVRDFTIFRLPVGAETGDVRGVVVDGEDEPVVGAYLALYLEGELLTALRSDGDGKFDFGTLPVGRAEIEAFDARTGLAGAQVFFDIEADTVQDVRLVLRDDRGTVEGRVIRRTLAGDSPVVGAVVWVSGTPFNTLTDATGFYRLEGVFAGNRTVLAADVPRGVQTSAQVTVSGGITSTRDLVFVESVAGGLAGEVLDTSGNPVAGATIHLAAGSQNWWNEAITDANGRWVMPNLAPGGYTIYAFKGQVGAVGHATIRFQGETPFVSIRFKKGAIRGVTKVRNGDGILVGVSSLVTYRTTVVQEGLLGLDWQERLLQTAADGSFEIPNVLMGPYVLSVSNAFHGEKTLRGELHFQGEVAQHEFIFEQAGEIRGVVYDWDGVTPLAGVRVDLRHPNFSAYDVTTDAEGKFKFALVPPSSVNFPIEAKFDDGVIFRQAQVWARLASFGQELDVEIVMPRQGTVGGWVEDANGLPVPGAVVTLSENAFPRRTIVRNADRDGYFSFTNVFAGKVALKAKAPSLGGLGAADTAEIFAEGEEVFSLLVLEATGEVIGQVISPATGLGVHAQVSLLKLGNLVDSVTTDEQGFFRFQLLRLGAYSLVYFDPRTGRHGRVNTAIVEYPNHVVEVVAPLEVRGEVDGHLREPGSLLGVPGATIQLTSHGIMPFSTFSSTDGDGYFEFLGIPEGSFTLKSREPAGRRKASAAGLIVEEGLRVTVDLLLEASGRVTGTVLNPAGAPAGAFENVNVLIRQDGQVVGATLANPFDFAGIIANQPFELQAIEIGGAHRAKKTGVLTGEGTVLTSDFPMVPIGKATVSVVDASGNPVAGAEVNLRANGFYGDQRFHASSGADGKAVFSGLGQGRLDAWARSGVSALTGSAAANLALENEMVQLTVQLESAGVVRGRVLLAGSTGPAVNALVVLTRGSRTLQTATDANGDFLFPSVPLGTFTVFVQEHFGPGTIAKAGSLAANGQEVDLGVLVLDDRDPRVMALSPEIGSTSLPLDTKVTIEFSEPLDRPRFATNWVLFRSLSGQWVNYSVAWSDGDRKLQLTPTAALNSFTGYEVIVQDAYDPAGRRLSDRVKTVFTTRDVVAPTVIDVLPRNNQIQVPVATQIRVTFSEPVVAASLNGSAMQLTDLTSGQGITTTFLLLPGERQVLLTPAAALATDHLFQLTLQGAQDGSGNTMSAPVSTRFTTVDTTPPAGIVVTFPAGTSFLSGAPVPVAVTATDANGVASAALEIGGWTFTDTASPFELSGIAPYVAAPTTVEVKVRAIDTYGNAAEVIREIQVSPRQNAAAPGLEPSCGSAGEVVMPGRAITLSAVAGDDEAVESVRLLVDGVEIGVRGPFAAGTAAAASFSWTPPSAATAGQSFAVRFEARDFAGNTKAAEFTLKVATGTVLNGGRSLNAAYDGQPLVLVSGTFILRADLHLPSLHVMAGASLVAPAPGNLRLEVDGALRVQCGGVLSANGSGYLGGIVSHKDGFALEGVFASRPDAGGSHGGAGVAWNGAGPAGAVYGGVYAPRTGGGGGAHDGDDCCNGWSGGGAIEIEADDLVNQGSIEANGGGAAGGQRPGGAGGSIFLRARQLGGRGLFAARGGNGGDDCSSSHQVGAGGGGRIALWTETPAAIDLPSQVDVRGGARYACNTNPQGYAAAGTAYLRSNESPIGILWIDNGKEANGQDRIGPATELPSLGSGATSGLAAQGADAWLAGAAGLLPERWLGAFVELTDAGGVLLGSFRVLEVGADGRLLLGGAGPFAASATHWRGVYRFDRVDLRRGGLAVSSELRVDTWRLEGNVVAPAQLAGRQLLIEAGAVVRAPAGSLSFRLSEKAEIRAGAKIDLRGAGYAGGTATVAAGSPAWAAPSAGDAGGSHGGSGTAWNGAGAAGPVYDSVYGPTLAGGGGAHDNDSCCTGSAGGGVLFLKADQVVLDGAIDARGVGLASLSNRPGGAGGAVWIEARQLGGAGSLDASGGDSGDNCQGSSEEAGPGGGGRIALLTGEQLGLDLATQVKAWGGGRYNCTTNPRGYAAPGTIFLAGPASNYGTLRIDSGETAQGGDRGGPPTVLPTLGDGALSATSVAGADRLIQREGGFRPEWQGVWVTLLGAGGAPLGTFEAAERDSSGALRLAGAAGVTGATHFRGEYRFDRLELVNGAGFDTADPVAGYTLQLEGETEVAAKVTAENVVVRAGAVVRPAVGQKMRFEVADTLTVESGARLDASGFGYAGGTAGSKPGQAPAGVAGSAPDAGGSHGGGGVPWNGGGLAGPTYDSVYAPRLSGGGGAHDGDSCCDGSAGGGAIEIVAGEVVLEGQIQALGAGNPVPSQRAGGAGGAVFIQADALRGGGSIDTSGGAGGDNCQGSSEEAGAGGGGRVALEVADLALFDPVQQVKNQGGGKYNCTIHPKGYAAPGTTYVKKAGDTYGTLLIDSGTEAGGADRLGPVTELPSLGGGAVAAFEAAGDDAFIARAGGFPQAWEGVFVELRGAENAALGTFRVKAIDAAGRILLAGAGLAEDAETAETFAGLYRFDRIDLRHGAGVDAGDPIGGASLVLEGQAEVSALVQAGDVLVKAGAVIRPAQGGKLRFELTGELRVEAGARIDVSGLGYAGGTTAHPDGFAPDGRLAAQTDGGGSHGGAGAIWNGGRPGEVYDSVYRPTMAGGGGAKDDGSCCGGLAGGGVLEVVAASVVLDGELRANGIGNSEHGDRPGGAGGSIYVAADSLAGAGKIDASGGHGGDGCQGSSQEAGAGGGGRVALAVGTLAFDPLTQVRAAGGTRYNCMTTPKGYAAPGTIFVHRAGEAHGWLLVDSEEETGGADRMGAATQLPTLGTKTVAEIAAANADAWVKSAQPFDPAWRGAFAAAFGAAGQLGLYRVLEIDAAGRVLLEGAAGSIAGATELRGRYVFDRLELRAGAGLTTADPIAATIAVVVEGNARLPAKLQAASLTVPSTSTVTVAEAGRLELAVSGTLKIETGGKLDLTGLGYAGGTSADKPGQAPPGISRSQADAGGSHGGSGVPWNHLGEAGAIYDSVYAPTLAGGGGAHDGDSCCGGLAGGGIVDITAGAVVLDGQILVRGAGNAVPSQRAGGAGGTLWLRAGSLSGGGLVDASGGDAGDNCQGSSEEAGAGGGGRVALEVGSFAGFDPLAQVKAWAGGRYNCTTVPKGYAAAGTVFVKKSGDTYGMLVVDAGAETNGTPRQGPATRLPALGSGAVTALEAAGADAWLGREGGFAAQWLGAWVVLTGGAGEELGAFRIAAIDAGGRALLAGAGVLPAGVAAGAQYRGEYRFDRIELRRSAGIDTADPIAATDATFSGDARLPARLKAQNLTIPSGSTVRVVGGPSLELDVAGTFTIAAGGKLDLSGIGYAGGTSADKPGQAPPGVSRSQADAGGSHGGAGVPWNHGGEAGSTYDSVYAPTLAGGGGAHDGDGCCEGLYGGGIVDIDAGTMVLDGQILARGAGNPVPSQRAGGAGGTVWLRAVSLSGAGLVDASGGDAGDNCQGSSEEAGAGGGGRVSLEVGSFAGFDPLAQVKAWAGGRYNCTTVPKGYAAAGTVYLRKTGDTYGMLVVDAGAETNGTPRQGPSTRLPSLGSGVAAALVAGGGDAWLSRGAAFEPHWLGVWVVLEDGAGQNLGAFKVGALGADGRVLLLGAGAAAGAAGSGAKFRGEYRFDRIELRRTAGIETADPILATETTFSGDAWVPAKLKAQNLTIPSGSTVRVVAGSKLELEVAGTLTIAAGGKLDLSGIGYAGGTSADKPGQAPAGVSRSQADAGGSHGGAGAPWNHAGEAGAIYDSVYAPTLAGGGGAHDGDTCCEGLAGGGILDIAAGAVVLDGQILVRGAGKPVPSQRAGGAGGTLWLRAGSLTGAGLVDASGGDSGNNCQGSSEESGAGGGGRVSLEVGSLAGFDPVAQVKAWAGGRYDCSTNPKGYAATGTIFVKKSGDTYGWLLLDAGAEANGTPRQGPVTRLPELGAGALTGFEAAGADAWLARATPFPAQWLGAWVLLKNAAGAELGAFRAAAIGADGRLRLAGAAAAVAATSYRGEYRFDRLELRRTAALDTDDPIAAADTLFSGDAGVPPRLKVHNLAIPNGSTVRVSRGGSLALEATGTLTIATGGKLDLSGTGYAGGTAAAKPGVAPAGLAASQIDAGGSHGGSGTPWTSAGPGGEVYGSVYTPVLAGGGGAHDGDSCCDGLAGGGVIDIAAAAVVLDGQILVRGAGNPSPSQRAGGAGGSLWLRAASLSGGGSVDASGGSSGDGCQGSSEQAGAGGGGRVALEVGSLTGFDPAAQAWAKGGARISCANDLKGWAAPGTVLVKRSGQQYGDLKVDQGGGQGKAVPPTYLPSIGRGTVGAIFSEPADAAALWIEPADPAKLFPPGVAGMWLRFGATDYRVIGLSADRRRLLVAGAAGAVQVGQAYVGVYKFDQLAVGGNANLESRDGLVYASQSVAAGSTLIKLDLEAPAVAITAPAAGASYAAGSQIEIAATASDNVGVAGVTFRLGDQSFVDTAAPYAWTVAAPAVGEETQLPIVAEAADAEGNRASVQHLVTLLPLGGNTPPVVAITCPSPGAFAAIGSGLALQVAASHEDGIERVELLAGNDPTVLATDFGAPYLLTYQVPAGAADGQTAMLKVRARSYANTVAETTLTVPIVAATLITADRTVLANDLSLEGQSVVVAAGTLTVQGSHSFRDLAVLDGAKLSHPATTATSVGSFAISVARDVFVSCGGQIDAGGRGYRGAAAGARAYGYPNSQAEGAASAVGGSHGGRGGSFDGSGAVYGSVFDPADPGAGGGSTASAAGGHGGGVLRLAALGKITIDGSVLANGATGAAAGGAGGAIRFDAQSLSGQGSISAAGAAGAAAAHGGGSGGRIALYAATIDAGLLSRAKAPGAGSPSTDPLRWGAAGTVFAKLDGEPLGSLILDNDGLASTQLTELPAAVPGTVATVDPVAGIVGDPAGSFPHSLAGAELAFGGDLAELWTIESHGHRGQSVDLGVDGDPLTAEAGDGYEVVYRFGSVAGKGGARGLSLARVLSTTPPAVGAGSSFEPAYAPAIAFTAPAAHAQFASGSQIAVTLGAGSALGVRQVVLSLGAGSATLTAAPYTWTAIAPAVTTATTMPIVAEVEDRSGHKHRIALPIEILPPSDPTAPMVSLAACPTSGELVAAGSVVTFAYQASDDQNLQQVSLTIGGVAVETRTVGQASTSGSFDWTVPAGAAPGTSFVAVVAAKDYAGNVTSVSRTLATPTGTLLSGGGTLGASYDGQDVVLVAGTFTASGPLHPRSLAILRGASLTRAAGSTLALQVDTELQVRCGGAIDLAGRGYAGGTTSNNGQAPSWTTPAGRTAGGAHGGKGIVGLDNLPAATAFDSVYLPSLGGGGGGRTDGNNPGGAGGGVAAISAATFLLDGEIKANGVPGAPSYYAGSGAGGSVAIHADLLRGVGKIDASGGNYQRAGGDWGGPGAGGRIALWVDDLSGFDLDAGTLYRGGRRFLSNGNLETQSAGGTLYVMDAGATYGDLWLDNEAAVQWPEAELVALGGGAVTAFEPSGADAWLSTAAPGFLAHWPGVWVRLADAAGVHLGTYRAMERDANGRLLLAGAAGAAGTPPVPATVAAYTGEYRFDRIQSRGGGGLAATDPLKATELEVSGQVRLPPRLEGHDLLVKSGAKVTPVIGGELQWTLSGELAVEAGATIDLSGRGFAGGSTSNSGQAPAGSTPAGRTAGGAHGGKGIVGLDGLAAASAFDSVYLPSLGGGGGGRTDGNNWGGAGGGVIVIGAAKITLNGQIKAAGVSGAPSYYAGSGAGGTILLRAGELDGTGLLDASGGDYQRAGGDWGGPGAGGRIALWIGDPSGFDLDAGTLLRGGRRFLSNGNLETQSAGGTLYLSHAASTYGELVVDNESALLRPEAELVALGGGQVEVLSTTGAPAGDAWLTSKAGAFAAHWAGVWVRLADSGGAPLGSFRASQRDSSGRLLLAGASGAASAAFSYLGEYKFDRMVSRNGGGVYATDPLLATAGDLSGPVRLPTRLSGHDLTVRAGATVAPVAGGELSLLLSGTLTVENGGAIDLSGRGYAGGTTSNNGQAPAWATPAGRTSGGGHGGKGPVGLDGAPIAGAFDSVYLPSLGGGGGGRTDGNNWGGAGGGVITIEAAHVVLDGQIKAAGVPGAPSYYAGSGAGGSIVLRADSLSGAGLIDVTGGNYQRAGGDWGGPGAGGRVALWVDDLSLFDLDAGTLYRGGRRFLSNGTLEIQAASGTLYAADAAATYGDLYVDAESTVQRPPAELVSLGGAAVAQLVAAASDGWLVSAAGALTGEWVGAWVAVRGADGASLGAFRVADRDAAGRLLLANAGSLAEDVAEGTVTGTLSYAGEYRFDQVLLRGGGSLSATDKLVATEADLSGPAGIPNTIGSATVRLRNGALVSPVHGRELRWTVSGTLTVESGAAIELSGRGYAGGTTSNSGETAPNVSPPAGRTAGGGHGGNGTVGYDSLPAAAVYDSLYLPALPGGGGGRTDGNNWGGAGGGVVYLTVGTLQIDGQIRARGVPGAPSYYAGSGAGGTILIEAQVLAGGGVLDVSGGSYQKAGGDWGGPGGGGRIAIYAGDVSGYNLAGAKAGGGRRIFANGNVEMCAAPGTIYVAGAAAHQGELILDGDTVVATPATKLPAIGAGSLAMVTADLADPADAWVEAQTTDPLFELGAAGAWLRIGGSDYRILGQSADRKKLLLENAAAALTAGQSYAGVHKLKKVTLRGSALLSQNDVLEVIP
jgi:hypothetical protein